MAKKRPLGFETPSMQIQEEYKKILKQIMAKKADWKKILKGCHERFEFALDGAKNVDQRINSKGATHSNLMELEHRILVSEQFMTQIIIAGLGIELAECDVRIAAMEKELKDLRKGLK